MVLNIINKFEPFTFIVIGWCIKMKDVININGLVGNTPMVKIRVRYNNIIKNIYVKLEYYNYTGSIKDRLAKYIIEISKLDGTLKEGMPIIEATSGNTGISFSALGTLYGHPVYIFMPDWVSDERINIMKMYGAEVILVSKEDGGFKRAIYEADKLSKEIDGFRPNQFSNIKNIEVHYNETGSEIVNVLNNVDVFINGIGTGGTLIGVGKRMKENFPKCRVVVIEPKKMPLLSKGIVIENHKIEGIGDDFIPDLVDMDIIDEIITIDDDDAINMARILARKLGLGVGISSGANFVGACLCEGNDVVTIFVDDMKKYLSTELFSDIDKNEKFISNRIEILSIEGID